MRISRQSTTGWQNLARAVSIPSSQEIEKYDCSIRSRLGIPNSQYNVNIVFPDKRKVSDTASTGVLVNLGSCPLLSSDHGSVISSDDLPLLSSVAMQCSVSQNPAIYPNDSSPSISRVGLEIEEQLVISGEDVQPIHRVAAPESFGSHGIDPGDDPGDLTSEGSEDEGSEEPDSIIDIVLAAFRGEPELLPEIYDILRLESVAYREAIADSQRRPAGGGSRHISKSAQNTPKKRRAVTGGDENFDEGGLLSTKRQAKVKKKLTGGLKFSCAFHKMFPSIYCAHSSISDGAYFYNPCAGPGWGEIRHLLDHYKWKHGRFQCPSCLEIFANIQTLTTHQDEGSCIRNQDRSSKEPIGPASMARIQQAYTNAVAEAPWSREEIRWYKICFILFPLSVPPKSPYFGQEAEIRLLRVVVDSLENRIQNTPHDPNSANLRGMIDGLRDICQRLGPALEEHDPPHIPPTEAQGQITATTANHSHFVAQQTEHSHRDLEFINAEEENAIDPDLLLWENRERINHMSDQGTNQQLLQTELIPDAGFGYSDEASPGTFRGTDDLFGDSGGEQF